jgi:predicted SnoaL-like aldol condensation-catalyzing enzyme
MSASAERSEIKNPKTGMTLAEMKEFIRNHFEEFVNRKNLEIGEVNFAPGFVDHGADVPPGLETGPEGAIQYVGAALKKVPDLRVSIEDLVAEDDKVVVRNHWIGTDAESNERLEFSGIVIWRIANRSDRGALGLRGEPSPPARLGSGIQGQRVVAILLEAAAKLSSPQ